MRSAINVVTLRITYSHATGLYMTTIRGREDPKEAVSVDSTYYTHTIDQALDEFMRLARRFSGDMRPAPAWEALEGGH